MNDVSYPITASKLERSLGLIREERNLSATQKIKEKTLTEEQSKLIVTEDGMLLQDVHIKFRSKEICKLAIENTGLAIQFVPSKFQTEEMYLIAVSNEPFSIKFIPEEKRTKKIVNTAFIKNPLVFRYIPQKHITHEMCLTFIETCSCKNKKTQINIRLFPEKMLNDLSIIDALIKAIGAERIIEQYNQLPNPEALTTKSISKKTIKYLQSHIVTSITTGISQLKTIETETSTQESEIIFVSSDEHKSLTYDLSKDNYSSSRTIYYITDIHLDHHLNEFIGDCNADFDLIKSFLENKIQEITQKIIHSSNTENDLLLIGGDVADKNELVTLFYNILSKKLFDFWNGTIISVLGNHELWDNNIGNSVSIKTDDIINNYSEIINISKNHEIRSILLQNAIYIKYKNQKKCIIEESQILNASEDDLRDICSKSSLILLGGIGFSGLNPYYNAELGLYGPTITTLEEDLALSQRFNFIYNKLNRCAGNKQVIVLTHTPVHNWTNDDYNPNWIYINGHTHKNSIIRENDGTTVLSDNQIGYKTSQWKLNQIAVAGWYDPFEKTKDGIHKITPEIYDEFNKGRGIISQGCHNCKGGIYALKRKDTYMFILQSESNLYLLAGGQKNRLKHNDMQYYYDNIELYKQNVYKMLSQYQRILNLISKEIRCIGGWGSVHGCIVDIDEFNHIYVNPFDGKVSPYWAEDKNSRYVYNDLASLLEIKLPLLYNEFNNAHKSGEISMLSQCVGEKKENRSILSSDSEIYDPSKKLIKYQYLFNNNVVRVWEDDILKTNFNIQLLLS